MPNKACALQLASHHTFLGFCVIHYAKHIHLDESTAFNSIMHGEKSIYCNYSLPNTKKPFSNKEIIGLYQKTTSKSKKESSE